MRIPNLIASLDPTHGGPVDGAIRIAEIWRDQGHQPEFATLDDPAAPYLTRTQIPVSALGRFGAQSSSGIPSGFLGRYGYSRELVPWLRAHQSEYDVILVHALWSYISLAARRVLVGSRIPYFVFAHGALSPWFRKAQPRKHLLKSLLWPISEGVLMNNAAAVLYTTQNECELANGVFRPYRVRSEVVGFGSSEPAGNEEEQIQEFNKMAPTLQGRDSLLFLGRIDPIKGCDILVHAFAKVAAGHPGLDLVFAGPDHLGWKTQLEDLAAAQGISKRIHWTGMVDGLQKWGALRSCKAFVLPSHSENFGVVVAEALSCGRPVLTTDKVSVAREVDSCRAGFVGSDSVQGVSDILERFLRMTETDVEAMSRRARLCFEQNFRSVDAALRILDLFEKSLSYARP